MRILSQLTILGIGSAACSWGLTEIFRRFALKKGMLDFPNERSSHTRPTPRGGGIGIVFVNIAVGAALLIGLPVPLVVPPFSFFQIAMVMEGALLIAAVSWLDDVRHGLNPASRLVVHSAAAALAIISLGGWDRVELPFIMTIDFRWIGFLLIFFWIVGLINAYNFMDGIDGIASVQAVTAAAGWTAAGFLSGSPFLFTVGILIGFSAVGFILQNWPPAKIFMGDIGSAFLGYTFAILPLLAGPSFSNLQGERLPVAGLLMVAPFVVDATFTILRRISRKEKIFQAHRSHLYQRLVLSGLSHRTVSLLYFALGIVGSTAGVGFIFLIDRTFASILVVEAVIIILSIPILLVMKRERKVNLLKGN